MFGIFNLHKPAGWTSRDVVNRVARLVRPSKAGHAGTLDPLATGVLIVCVGSATRLVPYIHRHSKKYLATFLLGKQSDTDDIEGDVSDFGPGQPISRDELEDVLPEFTGTISQRPPAYSAVKIAGQRAYHRARRGETVVTAPRQVDIHHLKLDRFSYPEFTLEIECSTGTYVRSLGRDIAARLGTSAVMSALVRTAVGPCRLDSGMTLEELEPGRLISPLEVLDFLPRVTVDEEGSRRIRQGQSISWSADQNPFSENEEAALVGPAGELLAIAQSRGGRLAPQIVFPDSSP